MKVYKLIRCAYRRTIFMHKNIITWTPNIRVFVAREKEKESRKSTYGKFGEKQRPAHLFYKDSIWTARILLFQNERTANLMRTLEIRLGKKKKNFIFIEIMTQVHVSSEIHMYSHNTYKLYK